MHLACKNNNYAFVVFLLQNGAELNRKIVFYIN